MKKEYLKPEMIVEQFMAEIAFLDASGMPSDKDPIGDDEIGANDRRGTWGDLWD